MSKDEPLFELDIEKLEDDIERVQEALEDAEEIAINAAKKEMVEITYDLLGHAMRRAPKMTGTLRGSGIAKVNDKQVAHTENNAGDNELVRDVGSDENWFNELLNLIVGEIVFNVPYATYQHEELDLNHFNEEKGKQEGEAKYLENPLKENAKHYIEGLAEAIEAELDKEGRGL